MRLAAIFLRRFLTEHAPDDAHQQLAETVVKIPLHKWLLATYLLSASKKGMSSPADHEFASGTRQCASASPARNVNAFQFVNASAGLALTHLTDLVSRFRASYLVGQNIGWIGHPEALEDIRNLELPGTALQEGETTRLLGYPFLTTEAMDAPGGSGFPIAIGNWRHGFAIVNRTELRISADEVSVPGVVCFYIRRRVGGTILNNEALKLLQF